MLIINLIIAKDQTPTINIVTKEQNKRKGSKKRNDSLIIDEKRHKNSLIIELCEVKW